MIQERATISLRYIATIFLFLFIFLAKPTNANLKYADNWGITKINVKKVQYTWIINNYSFNNMKSGEYLESPIFSGESNTDYKWRLRLYPQGNGITYNSGYDMYGNYKSKSYNTDISLDIQLVSNNNIKALFKLGLLNDDNELINNVSKTHEFTQNYNIYQISQFCKQQILTDNVTNKILSHDQLTVVAEIFMNDGFMNVTGHCNAHSNKPDYEHVNNYLKLLEDEILCDVQFIIGKYEFSAHKAILAAVSPVFAKQFKILAEEEIKENKTIIEMNDVNPKIFKQVLEFIYTGKLEKIEKIAEDVLPIANQYEIEQLKIMCEDALCRALTIDNAMDYFSLAELHNAEALKQQASNYIAANAHDVVNTTGYKSMENLNPHPILSIFRSLIETKN